MASANYRMADRLAGGNLAETLRRLSDEGLNNGAISRQLFADYGIEVSIPTVGAWLAILGTAADVA